MGKYGLLEMFYSRFSLREKHEPVFHHFYKIRLAGNEKRRINLTGRKEEGGPRFWARYCHSTVPIRNSLNDGFPHSSASRNFMA